MGFCSTKGSDSRLVENNHPCVSDIYLSIYLKSAGLERQLRDRVLMLLPEDQNSVPSTQHQLFTTAYKSNSWGYDTLSSGLCRYLHTLKTNKQTPLVLRGPWPQQTSPSTEVSFNQHQRPHSHSPYPYRTTKQLRYQNACGACADLLGSRVVMDTRNRA